MFNQVAIIGDSDLILPFRVLGIKVFSPRNLDEAREVLKALEKEKVALCFLHEKFFSPLQKERQFLEKKPCPVVVGYSDYREATDYLSSILGELAVKATGSDSLVKRRGDNEAR